ncbi:unnamed protein product [Blepharisma stoltei]|uniref:Endoplasmic reticulum-Golgi intermediate compartment protein n=1 Tax=Blepharisma stoltei TaxID=1481888 RepID=A0AAU9J657_9CILI|nr:unnamed protein product [Blepharisma stoltei]
MKSFKGLDLFRKSVDVSEQTLSGGIITAFAFSIMLILFISEISYYFINTVQKETLVDQDRGAKMLQINLNVTVFNAPCIILSLDQMDQMGTHNVDIEGFLTKTRLSKDGSKLDKKYEMNMLNTVRMIEEQEGCEISGHFTVNKVPGNFHISFHATHEMMSQVPQQYLEKIDISHRINHLSFGREHRNSYILSTFGEGEQTNFAPYDGIIKTDKQGVVAKHEYTLKIIPIQYYDKITGEEFHSYQFSMNGSTSPIEAVFGIVYFNYDIDNIIMKYTRVYKSLPQLIISLCAILGGVFTVLGIVNSIMQKY